MGIVVPPGEQTNKRRTVHFTRVQLSACELQLESGKEAVGTNMNTAGAGGTMGTGHEQTGHRKGSKAGF